MRQQGGKRIGVAATATERLRAIADSRSANSGREGRREPC